MITEVTGISPQRREPAPCPTKFEEPAKIDGKTVNRRLTPGQAEFYSEWINNDRRLRTLIQQMRDVATKATELRLTQAAEV